MNNHYAFLPGDMDQEHEKNQGLLPQYHELPAERKPLTSETQHVEAMAIEEPLATEDRGDPRRRDSVWWDYFLPEHQGV